jgi:hypothetical protein
MFVLEKRYGLAGYAFWFKLLELLGKTEGHFIDLDQTASEYLQAYTSTDQTTCFEILDLLAKMESIDPKLWKDKIIWSDNFVRGLVPAYRNREATVPARPDNLHKKPDNEGLSAQDNRRGKEGEEGEEGRRGNPATPPEPPEPRHFYKCLYFVVEFDYRMKLAKEFPALTDDLLLKEFSKMEDYISEHPKKYSFKSTGHLGNSKAFIRKWLERIEIKGSELFGGEGGVNEPKGYAALREARRRREQKNAKSGPV